MSVNNNIIKRVFSFKYLGICLDPSLSFNKHLKHVNSQTSSNLNFLRSIKRYLAPIIMKAMLNSHVFSIANYCLTLWAVQTTENTSQCTNKN